MCFILYIYIFIILYFPHSRFLKNPYAGDLKIKTNTKARTSYCSQTHNIFIIEYSRLIQIRHTHLQKIRSDVPFFLYGCF